jgi:hypothetical protein
MFFIFALGILHEVKKSYVETTSVCLSVCLSVCEQVSAANLSSDFHDILYSSPLHTVAEEVRFS